eukprot:6487276-Amphidinium_carterae.3
MLEPTEEIWQELDHAADLQAYWDPSLAKNDASYAEFVDRLMDLNIVGLTTEPLETNGLFFVKKKNGKLRMICDCRRANRRLRIQ